MIVVNDPKNLAPRILVIKLKRITKMFQFLLDSFSKQGRNCGVKRNNYYLFTVDALWRYSKEEINNEYKVFIQLVKYATYKMYTYIMIVNP